MKCRISFIVIMLFSLFPSIALAETFPTAEIDALFADRNYAEAASRLQDALTQTPDNADYLAYLLGNALFYQKEYAQAIERFQQFAADYPQSKWLPKALFRQADCYLALKQFQQAGDIYLPQVTQLVSAERKERVAAVYLDFATAYFSGEWVKDQDEPGLEKTPDYARAKVFYELALQLELSPAKSEDIRLNAARCAYELTNYDEAITLLTALQKEMPEGTLRARTAYYLGQSYLKQGNLPQARRVFRDFAADFPQDEHAPEVAFLLSRAFRIPTPASTEELELGVKSLQEFVAAYSADKRASQAEYEIGLSYYNFGRLDAAASALTAFIQKHAAVATPPTAAETAVAPEKADEWLTAEQTLPLARFYLGSVYQRQRKFQDAIAVWQEFLQTHPSHNLWNEAQRQIVETEYLIAANLRQEKQFDAARDAFEQFLNAHPLDPRNPDIMFQIGDMLREQEAYQDAVAQWKRAVSKYPQTDPASQAQFEIGQLLESKLLKFEEAFEAYKQVTWGSHYGAAQERMSAMQAKRLAVQTERVFRSNETPALKVTTRNIETLTLKMYKVDLETYFRKNQTVGGVESLDIALIDPDKTWQETIADYEKYREFENRFVMQFAEPGAYLVTCSEESVEGGVGYEATTLVLVSDLDVIVKTTKRDALVFAENMRTGAAYPGVKFLFSDGAKIFYEGATQPDGVFHAALKELKETQNLRVFAFDGKHYAASALGLDQLQFVEGVSARGYIYTDRPAYRPGQQVSVKGILREADEAGNLRVPQLPENARYAVQIQNSQGATIFQDDVALSEFGTFAVDATLNAAAPTGEYRIFAQRDDQPPFSGAFVVEEYKLEKIKLTLETDREVYFRGETITGKIRAAYYYGEPAREKSVSYTLGNVELLAAKTDRNGEIAFTLDTRDFTESQPVTIFARLDEESVQAGKTVFLATRGFSCEVATLRDVYLVNEDIEATVKTTDPAGKPTQETLTFGVFKLEKSPSGETSERKISEQQVTTGADGSGKALLKLADGGDYMLRAEGRDRFENPVSGESRLFISGKDDEIKLRILTDAEEFKVGDAPEIRLSSNAADGLALLTYEGETMLSYQILNLKNGVNPLTLAIGSELAPNFTLSAAQMEGNKFHEAQKYFAVLRQLNVALTVKRADAEAAPEFFQPKENVTVEILTTDQNGKPVPAELSLAMIDEALYARYAESALPIRAFFYDQKRESASQIATSCTFRFDAETKELVSELLDEEARIEEETVLLAPEPAVMSGEFDGNMLAGRMDEAPVLNAPGQKVRASLAKDKKEAMLADALEPAKPMEAGRDEAGAFLAALREYFPETGYWNPRIVTDENGKATVTVTLPDSTTEWRFTSRGVTRETLVGETTAGIVTKLPFFADMKTPPVFLEGDKATLLASVQNSSGAEQQVNLTFSAQLDGAVIAQQEQTVAAPDKQLAETAYRLDLSGITPPVAGSTLTLELSAAAGQWQDRIRREVAARAWGAEFSASKSGAATDDASVNIALPAGRPYISQALTILLNPSVDRTLLDLIDDRPWPCKEPSSSSIHQAQIVLNVLRYLERDNLTPSPSPKERGEALSFGEGLGGVSAAQIADLRQRLKGLLNAVEQQQNADGGWNWTGLRTFSDLFIAADAVSLLADAKRAGFAVRPDVLQNGLNYVKQQFQAASDNDVKTYLLYAMTAAGDVDFAHVNRVYRERNSLHTAGLALLALTSAAMNRPEIGAELSGMLTARATTQTNDATGATMIFWASDSTLRSMEGEVETTALALLALQKTTPQAPQIPQAMAWLDAQRRWMGWGSTRANARIAPVLLEYFTASQFAENRYALKISVNGKPLDTLSVNGEQAAQTLRVPAELLNDGENRVDFEFDGRGAFQYVCVLTGVSRELAETHQYFDVKRYYEPAPLLYDGREIQRGFSVLDGSYETWRNPVTQIPLGGFTRVTVEYNRRQFDYDRPYMNQPILIEEPLPAGAMALEQSIQGDLLDHEIRDGKLMLYPNNANYGTITYDLYGYLPGAFRVLPTKVSTPYLPERFDYAAPYDMTVLERGQAISETYKKTPDELYYLGKALFDDKRRADARPLLSELFEQYRLESEPYRDTAKMLMYIAIDERNSRDIVRFFEVLKEKYPDLVLSFADILQVAQAYRDIQEHERAVQVLRATAEASFLKDVQVSGTLEAQGKFLPSVEYTRNTLLEYPDAPVTETAFYGLSQLLYTEAETLRDAPQSKRGKLSRNELLQGAIAMLQEFLTRYPEQKIADEVSFSLANAYLDSEEFERVVALARQFRQRYPQSPYLSAYEYLEGYADFELERYDESLQLCRKVATEKYPDRQGNLVESDHKYLAMYLMGQMYHAMGKPEQAIAEYAKVKERFPDANEAMTYFTKKLLEFEEVTTFSPGETIGIALRYRNIKDVNLLAYRVDLMKFYLLQKNLENVAAINLAGITPYHQATAHLGEGKDYAEKTQTLALPLQEEGAYLVTAKEAETDASGLVLISPLRLEVEEDAQSGRVRVNVINSATNRYENNAHVKVIGANDAEFISGSTDLRGIFIADNIHGAVTVIARKGNQYAFYRGKTDLQPQQSDIMPQSPMDMRSQATQYLRESNMMIQQQGAGYLRQQLYQNTQQGVEVQATY